MRGASGVAGRAAWALVAVAGSLLAACAGPPPETPVAGTTGFSFIDTPFIAEGRLSARRGRDAITVHFAWSHEPPRDNLAVTSPLGQTVAELSGDASTQHVEVMTADGKHSEASDWTTLTERALGFPLPVSGLAAWIRAAPHPGSAYSVEPDPEGRVALLRQDGWEVAYDYSSPVAQLPLRLRITYPEFEIRVAVDQWR